ncbi:hypothetical protein COT29_00975 [Candidatus Micrarchaeota archaeon CG08_land_8_20_14_0_20_59_11]|nr:MAG: hypothetical protein COT29_00975 [Candidatus Micrarchaeota archaeon CG08_land_8_20_14_0_20_59_11]
MSFKQAGHWRYLSLLNNRDEDVTLTVVGQGATMDCNLKKAPDDDALEPLQTGTVITAGEAAVYKCVGKSSGDYVVTFTGERSGKTLDKNGKQLVFTKQIIVKVWDPVLAAYAGIYTDTPLGSVYVSEAYMAVEYPEQAAEEEGTAPTEETPVEEKSSSAHEAGATTASLAEEEEEAPTELGKVEGYAPEMYHICRNYFCTYTESEAAFRTFLQLTLYSLDDKTKNEVSLNRLCAQLPAGKQSYQRSSVIQMTNTLSELGEKKRDLMTLVTGGVTKASEIAVGAGFDGGVVLDPQTNNQELRGCGVYVATAVADLKCANRGASVEEWRKDIVLQVFVRKIAECPVNVANAALLTAEEPEELVGKERIGVFGKFDTSGVEGIFDVIGKGVYKFSVYSESSDSHNAETAKILHSALYGENFKGEWVKQGSVPIYENADFCIGESGKRIAAEAGSVATLLFATAAALQVAQAAGTLGTSLLVSAPGIIEALAKATTICGMDLPREGLEAALITHEFSSCDIANDCAYAVIMAGFDVLFTSLPGGKGAMAMRAVGRRIATDTAYTAMGTVGVLGVEGIITGNEIKESVPYAYGGGRAFRGIRFASAAPVAGNRLFNRKMLMLYGLDAARSGRIAGLAAHLGPNLMKTTKQTVMPLLLDGADNINALPDADPFFTKIGVSKADLLKNGITKSDDLYAFINNGLGYDAAKYGALKTTTAGTLNDDLFKEFLGEIKGYNVETTALADLVNNEIKPLSSQLESLTTALGVQQAAKQTKQVTAQIAQINQQMAPLKEKIKELGELSGGVRTGSGITGALSTTQRSTLEKIFSTSSGDDILKRGALTKQAFDELSDVVAKGGRGTLTGRELLQLSDDARLKGLGSGRLKTINYAMENADGIKVKAGADIPKKSGWRFLKKVGPALAAIVATILFHVETKPVRAELDGQKISHYVVSTTEPSELWNDNPTIYAYCQKAGDEQTCPDGTDVKLQTVCSEEATGCVKIAKANSLSNVQGYTLFVTMNDEALRQEEKGVLSSLFEPNEPPFSPKEKAAEAFGKFETGVIEK